MLEHFDVSLPFTLHSLTDIHLFTIYGLCHFFRLSTLFYILILKPGWPIYCLAVLLRGVSTDRIPHWKSTQISSQQLPSNATYWVVQHRTMAAAKGDRHQHW